MDKVIPKYKKFVEARRIRGPMAQKIIKIQNFLDGGSRGGVALALSNSKATDCSS